MKKGKRSLKYSRTSFHWDELFVKNFPGSGSTASCCATQKTCNFFNMETKFTQIFIKFRLDMVIEIYSVCKECLRQTNGPSSEKFE